MIGSVIKDTYRIDRYLGEGGPSIVYQGTDLLLGVPVAIKRLKMNASMGDGSSMAERFLREARTHARLTHQNIVGIRAVLEEQQEFFIVMEYVDGGDLTHLLAEIPKHQLSISDATSLFGQVLLGLDYAHRNKVIHRDIKPSNILITQDRCAKIADFGLARATTDHRITGVGFLVGTLTYMSPEQLQGGEASPRSDIYGLGVSLYEGLAGFHPFVREGEKLAPYEICSRHLFQNPPLLHTLREDVPKSLSYVVQRSLAKKPQDRYQDAMRFAEDLHAAVEGVSSLKHRERVVLSMALQSGSLRPSFRENDGAMLVLPSDTIDVTANNATSDTEHPHQTGLEPTAPSLPGIDEAESSDTAWSPQGTNRQPARASLPTKESRFVVPGSESPRISIPISKPIPSGTRELHKQASTPIRPPAQSTPAVAQPDPHAAWLEKPSPVPRNWKQEDQSTHASAEIHAAEEQHPSVAQKPSNQTSPRFNPEAGADLAWSANDEKLIQLGTHIARSAFPDTWVERVSPLDVTNPGGAGKAKTTQYSGLLVDTGEQQVPSIPASPGEQGWKIFVFFLFAVAMVVAVLVFWQDWQGRLGTDSSHPVALSGSNQDAGLGQSEEMVPAIPDQTRRRRPHRSTKHRNSKKRPTSMSRHPVGGRQTSQPPAVAPSKQATLTMFGQKAATYCASLRGGMAYIPGGAFVRGYQGRSKQGNYRFADAPTQSIRVSGFCMDRHEVTVGEYQQCINDEICVSIPWRNSWKWQGKTHPGHTVTQVLPNHQPMRYVRWQDAQLFCRWQQKRLPTEAEWEWAARGDEGWNFPWGKQKPTCHHAVHAGCRVQAPQPVTAKRKLGSNPFQVLDLAGNVAEWVQDCYDKDGYHKAVLGHSKHVDPLFDQIPCALRVVRGGSFRHKVSWLRAYTRMSRTAQQGTAWIGFRCVTSVKPR